MFSRYGLSSCVLVECNVVWMRSYTAYIWGARVRPSCASLNCCTGHKYDSERYVEQRKPSDVYCERFVYVL